MRIQGTKYPKIEKLPANAVPVRMFADSIPTQVPQVYIRYDRFISGKSQRNPGYEIRQYQNTNYVIPGK